MMRRLPALLGALALATAIGTADAAPQWIAPENLSPPGDNGPVQVAVGSAGDAIVLWRRSTSGHDVVRAARFDPDTGAWGSELGLSAGGQDAADARLAVGGRERAVVVWSRSDGINQRVQATRFDPGAGSWSPPVDLSAGGLPQGFGAVGPDVAMDATGGAMAVWARHDPVNLRVQASRYDATTGVWGTPVTLSQAGASAAAARVALTPLGDAVAVWRRFDGAHLRAQAARYDRLTATWGPPATLSDPGASASNPDVAVDLAGNAVAVWDRPVGADDRIQYSRLDAGTGAWSAPDELSDAGQDAGGQHVVLNPAGVGFASWFRSDGVGDVMQTRRIDPGGAVGPVVDLSPPGQDAYGRIAVSPLGDAVAVYYHPVGTVRVRARRFDPVAGLWHPATDVSEPGEVAVSGIVDMDGLGNAFAAWFRDAGAQRVIRAAGLDAVAPRVAGLTVPSTASVGEVLTLSVTATDLFGLGATRWDFGDGSQFDPGVPIGVAQHTYTAPGTFTVTVTQRDAVGSESSASAQVTVAGSPVTPTQTPAPAPALAARCAGRAATIVGTPGRDVIRGTRGPDVIHSLGGNDLVRGLGGGDLICLGSGNDRGIGGGGADRIFGQSGNDRIDGSAGNDRLFGGSGNDRLRGQNGNDRHVGGPGRDIALGGRGHDRLDGGTANDRLLGGPGRDVLLGRSGRDLLAGGGGRDLALGGSGNDRLFGNGAADRLDGGRGRRDLASGGSGADRCIRAEIRRSC